MAAIEEEEDEVDIEGIEDDDKTADYKDMLENTHFNNKANLESTSGSFYSEFCDSSSWCLDPNSVLSLDHCDDEKSRATIEKMILEEELYSHGYGRMLEVPTTPLQPGKNKTSVAAKEAHISPKPKRHHVNAESLSSTHRKPWSKEEQEVFQQGLAKYGRSWTRIASLIHSRTVLQVKNYANQYFKNKDKASLPTKGGVNNGQSIHVTRLEGHTKLFPSSSSTSCALVGIDTKSPVNTGPMVHIEKTSDEEEIEVDIDGDFEEEVALGTNAASTDDVYKALLKSVSDTEDSSSGTENSDGCQKITDGQNKDVSMKTTGKPRESGKDEQYFEWDCDKTQNNVFIQTEKDDEIKNENNEITIEENTVNTEYKSKISPGQVNDAAPKSEDIPSNQLTEDERVESESRVIKKENKYDTILDTNHEKNSKNITSCFAKDNGVSDPILRHSIQVNCTRESNEDQQPRATIGEVTSSVPTSTDDKRYDLEDIKINVDLVLEKDKIHNLEKICNQEFFMGRSLKTPNRYIKIRNYILDMWDKTKPNYLYKTSVRSGLRNCGDVNSIGRVHAFLEDIGAINVGCSEKPRPRPRNSLETGIEKVEDAPPMESWTDFLRPRKRKVRDVDGDWVDESQAEGLTISHFPHEDDEVQEKQLQEKVSYRKPKVPRNKPSYNPFLLVPCRKFSSSSSHPFDVVFQSDALLVIDVHSHLSTTEVIGLLGGTYSEAERVLKILRAAPCKSLSTGMQCEMDPVSQTQASEELSSIGLSVVGWYHSHPTFAPSPSIRDIETQAKFQEWFGKGGAPFIGVIASPYNYTNTSNQSQITSLTVSEEWETAGQYRLPYQFDYKIQEQATDWIKVVDCINELEAQYQTYKYRMPMTRRYSSSAFTALDKLTESLRPRLRGPDEEKQDFINELKNIFTSDLESWSNERQENLIRSKDNVASTTNDNDISS